MIERSARNKVSNNRRTSTGGIKINPPPLTSKSAKNFRFFYFCQNFQQFKFGVFIFAKISPEFGRVGEPFLDHFFAVFPCKTPKKPQIFRALRAQFSWGVFIFANSQPYFFWFFYFCQNLTKCFMGGFYLGGVLIFIPPV